MIRIEAAPSNAFQKEVLRGLNHRDKELPCKYLYDKEGCKLFDLISELEEYYPTRTETAVTEFYADEMCRCLGEGALLVEFGCGNGKKTRILLKRLLRPAGFVPVDISQDYLEKTAARIKEEFQSLAVVPVCGDFTRLDRLPFAGTSFEHIAVYFPGSTIGNFKPDEAVSFLRNTASLCGRGGGLLIGVDLQKDPEVLEAAYNDAPGVTARFNLNLLARINREMDADFRLDCFFHKAFYNRREGCIEMHLLSTEDQLIHLGEREILVQKGESILTERSYKYTIESFGSLALRAGFRVRRVWTDARKFFSVQYLTPA